MKQPDDEAGVSRETLLSPEWIAAAGAATGLSLDSQAVARFGRYLAFLATEGIASGGIGPSEVDRLLDRHLADSLAFAPMLPDRVATAVDVGSGIGLPGIPLAIASPATSWVLLDRSGRRCHLMRRAVRMLELENATVIESDVDAFAGGFDVVTFRASLRPEPAAWAFQRLADPLGVGVLALSRLSERPDAVVDVPGVTTDVERLDLAILDSPAWFLRMRAT